MKTKRSYEKKITLPDAYLIHNEVKKRSVPHANGTVSQYLFANGIDYQRYIQSIIRGKLPVSYVIKLHELGVPFSDDVLCLLFPKSQ